MIELRSVQARVFRAPVDTPVVTSFGVMRDRPAVLVRVQDADGTEGWGETWCNFPATGAEHRARLVDGLAELVGGRRFAGPADCFALLTEATEVLALQSGEPGPFAAAIAGIDLALWDLEARKAGLPLFRLLGGSTNTIGTYASGINPGNALALARDRQAAGFRAFKVKLGFGTARDRDTLDTLRAGLPGVTLMADVNQGWTLDAALAAAPMLHGLDWLEEPLRADRPWSEWRELAAACPVPLAGGENIAGPAAFAAALDVLTVVQPDAAKWGGISGLRPVIGAIQAARRRYCPHWLGAGVGLLHSAHLLAASGGTGLLEVDSNPNPLRTCLCGAVNHVSDGEIILPEHPGIGPAPDLHLVSRFLVPHA